MKNLFRMCPLIEPPMIVFPSIYSKMKVFLFKTLEILNGPNHKISNLPWLGISSLLGSHIKTKSTREKVYPFSLLSNIYLTLSQCF